MMISTNSHQERFLKVTIDYATVYSNRWQEPIRKSHPLNSAFNWTLPTVAANSCVVYCLWPELLGLHLVVTSLEQMVLCCKTPKEVQRGRDSLKPGQY